MKLSIVTTMFHSAPYVSEFYQRVRKEAEALTTDFELIFVNDGSPDDALDIALALQKEDARIDIIDLSRNFGHHKAIITGLAHATGDLVFLIDVDLEEPPEILGPFFKVLADGKADVEQLVRYKEHLSNIIGLWEITGFRQVLLPVRKSPYKRTSTYTLRRRMAVALFAITAFSGKPLRYIAYLGCTMTTICALYIIFSW